MGYNKQVKNLWERVAHIRNDLKRKSMACCILVMLLILFIPGASWGAEKTVAVYVDGMILHSDAAPIIINGRTMVPFRAIAETMSLEVGWQAEQQTVTVKGENLSVKMQVGSQAATVNGNVQYLDAAPVIISGRTMVPLRFIGEALGCEVRWDQTTRTVSIETPPASMLVTAYYALGDRNTSSWEDLFAAAYPYHTSGNTDIVDSVALGWYSLDSSGELLTRSTTGWQRPEGWEDVLEALDEYGLQTEMVIHMTDTGAAIRSLLVDENACNRAVSAISLEAVRYDAVNLDLEGLGYRDSPEDLTKVRNDFTRFVSLLAGQLNREGKELVLSLHPPNSAYRGYDYGALGKLADRIIIMAYDYGSVPEPDDLVMQAVESALTSVPADKLVLGISIPRETNDSIKNKVGIARRFGLQGVALWRLGLINDNMWGQLHSRIE